MTPHLKEDVDKVVCNAFDELRLSLSEKETLHPSEECHRQSWLCTKSKLFEIINSYHVFCHLCHKHAYSRSVPTDINSFFQAHINSEYHRECRSGFPHSEEMIVWEEKWRTGKCNACQMSDMVAFVIDQDKDLTPLALFREHYCHWNKDMRENNEEFVWKINLLKKYCKLSFFREKVIKPFYEGSACLLCCLKIPWSGDKVNIHLGSQNHLDQFCSLVKNKLDLSPKDLLNGFNLEMVTRWIYECKFSPKEYDDYESIKSECSFQSRNKMSLILSLSPGHYCPEEIERLLVYKPSDFDRHGTCLLCDQRCGYNYRHFFSDHHREKSKNLSEKSFESSERYEAFYANLKSRLLEYSETIKLYNQLKEGKDLLRLKIGKINCEHVFVKKMFLNKLAQMERSNSDFSNENYFCEICDLLVTAPFAVNHLRGCGHLYHSEKWKELMRLATEKKFFEPFRGFKKLILCLLCGVSTESFYHFFSHLKGTLHGERFQEYLKLKNEVPICSMIDINRDLSVVCYGCDSLILKKYGVAKFKENFKAIRKHWPCFPVLKDGKNVTEISKCRTCGSFAETHNVNCPTDVLNFKNIENALRETVKACGGVIFKRVMGKIKKRVLDKIKAIEEDGKQQQEADTECECGKPESECRCESPGGYFEDSEPVDKNCKELKIKTLKNEKSESKKAELSEAAEEKKQEVLVISGLKIPKNIFKKFTRFGKIQGKYNNGKFAIVAFAEKGIAKKVAGSKNLFGKNKKSLSMWVELRKVSELGGSKFPSMPPDMLQLLEEPSNLLDFVANLTADATAMSGSVKELEREKSVCATINSAVFGVFPKCRCYPFGSRLSGLMSNDSDLDVFLDCGGMYEGMQNTSQSANQALIHKVGNLLRNKMEVRSLKIIARARVPIISFLHEPTGLHCDLSFKNALSVHKTLLIKFLVSLNYQAKFVIIFLKHWVKENGIHGPSFFSTYAITMMAIFYFQQLNPPMMPTVEELQGAFVGRRLTIGGWDCNFSENAANIVKKACDYPFQVILRGFFSYYANFEYDKFVISPVNGKPVPREAFCTNSQVELPLCYKRHILNYPQPLDTLVCQELPLCVVDPFDLSHVLTKSFTPNALQLFKHFCHLSATALKSGVLRMFLQQ